MSEEQDIPVFEELFDYDSEFRRAKEDFDLTGAELLAHMNAKEAKALERYERRLKLIEAREVSEQNQARAQEDRVMREMELAHAREMRHMELQANAPPVNTRATTVKPKLPPFEEGRDDIDAYLHRFVLYATSCGWPQAEWGLNLGALLKGPALEVFSRMAAADAADFEEVRQALFLHFRLTEEGFRRKFFSSRPAIDETATQFLHRVTQYFDRWVAMTKINTNYIQLRALVVKEQFLHGTQRELEVYVREKLAMSLGDVQTHAERFAELHSMYKKGTSIARVLPSKNRWRDNMKTGPVTNSPVNQTPSPQASGNDKKPPPRVTCFKCGLKGHYASDCPAKGKPGETSSACTTLQPSSRGDLVLSNGSMDGKAVTVLRDTGSEVCLVRESLVQSQEAATQQAVVCKCAFGDSHCSPGVMIDIDTQYYKGTVLAIVSKEPAADVVIGNIPGAVWPDYSKKKVEQVNVVTRGQEEAKKRAMRPLKVIQCEDIAVQPAEMSRQQKSDESLKTYFELAEAKSKHETKSGNSHWFVVENELLFRWFRDVKAVEVKQLVVPDKYRQAVMKLAHDTLFAGHLAAHKTQRRIETQFYWPRISSDVKRYCSSCDICQRTVHKGRVSKVPLEKMPVVDTPFTKVACDIVGPIAPPTERGHRYILTIVDFATRYPDSVPLKNIDTETVAEALVSMFSRVGIPKEMLTDRGTQFTGAMMNEVSRLLSLKQLFTTPYHAQCNGLVERFQGTMKQMLKRLCENKPKDWDRYLLPLLFSYREAPQDSTGFSPFELLYGRTVRGPMAILRDVWAREELEDDVRTTYQYVLDLRDRLENVSQLAADNLLLAQKSQHQYFNRKAKPRSLKTGDKVLLLLPTDDNKLLTTWKGPYLVTGRKEGTVNDYYVEKDGKTKLYHINMLKRYLERETVAVNSMTVEVEEENREGSTDDSDEEFGAEHLLCDNLVPENSATYRDCHVNEQLSHQQRQEVWELLQKYESCFSNEPGSTTLIEHVIELTTDEPVRVKPYPVSYAMQDQVKKEVESLIDGGLIEPSTSPYCSPLLLVAKKDGTHRPVIDFRQLNKITRFDAEPMPDAENIFAKIHSAKYLSKVDCTKGYNQVPLRQSDREKTAFSSPFGLFQWCVLPFGLVNSGATYNKLMRILLKGTENTESFVDDCLVHNQGWNEHLRTVEELLKRLTKAGMTVKPAKCYFGYATLEFVGHIVGSGWIRTMEDKIQKVKEAVAPTTQKQLKSLLGLAGYYRNFIPHYSDIVLPLTNLTAQRSGSKLSWGEAEEEAFLKLKEVLTADPVLKLADLSRQFILRTDASGTGLGAVLLQETDGEVFPVAYASKKLSVSQRKYSVIELECLAVVWGIAKFYVYLYGKEFLLQVDHQPLVYLQRAKYNNNRLMRWALYLQQYKFTVQSIAGLDNIGADYLSRSSEVVEDDLTEVV